MLGRVTVNHSFSEPLRDSFQDFGSRSASAETRLTVPSARGFIEVLQSYTNSPPAEDRYFGSFAAGTLEAHDCHKAVRELLDSAWQQRMCAPSYAVKLLLGSLQYAHIEDPDYPYEAPAEWRDVLIQTVENPDTRHALYQDLTTHELQSNKSERYKSVRLFLGMQRERLGDAPTILDIGCSLNLGLKQLAGVSAFEPVRLDGVPGRDEELLGQYINNGLLPQFPDGKIGHSLGIDTVDPDEETVRRAESDSHYPSELSPENREKFHTLFLAEHEKVSFAPVDLLAGESLPTIPEQGFDLVTMCTMLYQLSEVERIKLVQAAGHVLSANGFVVVQDFAYPDETDPQQLRFRENWFSDPYPYRTMVYDMAEPERGYRTLFSWSDGRADRTTRMRPSAYALDLLYESM